MLALPTMVIRARDDEWEAKVLPVLIGKVFHVTRPAGYSGICADREIRSNQNGSFPCGFPSPSLSFSRYYNCISFYDLRDRSRKEIELGWSGCHPLLLHQREEQVIYLILGPSEFVSLVPSREACARPLPAGIDVLNHIPLECWHPGPVPIESLENIIRVDREPSPPSELEQLFDDAGWPKT